MLVGKEVIHEYRGRGTVMAVENGRITVRFGADYDLEFPYPGEFREYDPEAQRQIDADIQKERMARAESYRRQRRGE